MSLGISMHGNLYLLFLSISGICDLPPIMVVICLVLHSWCPYRTSSNPCIVEVYPFPLVNPFGSLYLYGHSLRPLIPHSFYYFLPGYLLPSLSFRTHFHSLEGFFPFIILGQFRPLLVSSSVFVWSFLLLFWEGWCLLYYPPQYHLLWYCHLGPVVLDVMGLTPFLFDVSGHLLLLLLKPSFCVVSVRLSPVLCLGLSLFFRWRLHCSPVIWSHLVLPFYFVMFYYVASLACILAGIRLCFRVVRRGFSLSFLLGLSRSPTRFHAVSWRPYLLWHRSSGNSPLFQSLCTLSCHGLSGIYSL